MSFLDNIKGIKMPSSTETINSVKDARIQIQNQNINRINVRFYRKNSPFYIETMAELKVYGDITIGIIKTPDKYGFILLDKGIEINQKTKDEWVNIRQDYPCSLNVNESLLSQIDEAKKQNPDCKAWYLPNSINSIPVQEIIMQHNQDVDPIDIIASGVPKSLVNMIDTMPSTIKITGSWISDFVDIKLLEGLHKAQSDGNFVLILMGFLMGAAATALFALYIG